MYASKETKNVEIMQSLPLFNEWENSCGQL